MIGYIIGIIMGLYFKISIVFFYIPIAVVYGIRKILRKNGTKIKREKKLKLFSIKRYFRYFKLIFNSKVILCIIIFSIISNVIVIFKNKKYENFYQKDGNQLRGEAIVVSNREEKEYCWVYKVRILSLNENPKYKNMDFYIKIDKKSTSYLEYGDKINFLGEFLEPVQRRNFFGFDYKQYLKTLRIYGTIKIESLKILSKNKINPIFQFSNQLSLKIGQKIDSILDEEKSAIVKGILLGDSSQINEDIYEQFKISNISHILAVSGMHVTYLISGIYLLFKPMIGKRKTEFITIFFMILYLLITVFSPSVVRACIMGMLLIGSNLSYRKNDFWNSIAFSLLCILVYNPFLLLNIGLQFSYFGTIGIVVFYKNIFNFLKSIKIKKTRKKYRLNRKFILIMKKVKEILSVTISAQLAILPIMLYHFNLFGTYFFISNLFINIIIGPIILLSVTIIIFSFLFMPIAKTILPILNLGIQILIFISNLSKLPLSKIYFVTPKIGFIMLYYFLFIILNFVYKLYNSKKLNSTQIRIRNLIAVAKYKFLKKKKRYLNIIIIVCTSIIFINFIPQKLKIHFVDVGQGDCTFIETPQKKTILIDGGGSNSKEFDVGKNTLLPYILDKGYTKIDYIFISHFDQDHVGRFTICYGRNKSRDSNYRKAI